MKLRGMEGLLCVVVNVIHLLSYFSDLYYTRHIVYRLQGFTNHELSSVCAIYST